MKIWYLAHPVKGDEHFTTEQNLAHALEVQQILFKAGIVTVMPWYSYVVANGAGEGEYLSKCLEIDCEMVMKLGRLVLTGHRLSYGMGVELDALDGEIIDLIGIPDSLLAEAVSPHIHG